MAQTDAFENGRQQRRAVLVGKQLTGEPPDPLENLGRDRNGRPVSRRGTGLRRRHDERTRGPAAPPWQSARSWWLSTSGARYAPTRSLPIRRALLSGWGIAW